MTNYPHSKGTRFIASFTPQWLKDWQDAGSEAEKARYREYYNTEIAPLDEKLAERREQEAQQALQQSISSTDPEVQRRNRRIQQEREIIEQAEALGFVPDPKRVYEGWDTFMQAKEFLDNPTVSYKTMGYIGPVHEKKDLPAPFPSVPEPNLLSKLGRGIKEELINFGFEFSGPERKDPYPAWGIFASPDVTAPSEPERDIAPLWKEIADITQPSPAPEPMSSQQTQSGSASSGSSSSSGGGSTSTASSSIQPVSQNLGVPAGTTVSRNETTNYGGAPVRIDSDGIYNVPAGSLGARLLHESRLGLAPGTISKFEDAEKARGMQESEYWQDQYAKALAQTGNPNLARAHANLAATQASDNAYGVFDRAMAEQTMKASALGNNQINGQLYLDRNAGAVNQGLLSTAPQAYGANGSGGTLIRLPSGQVVSANMNANTPAMISATSLGADAAYNQDLNYTQAMAKLDEMKAQLAGVNSKNNPNDPLYQLNLQLKLLQAQKYQQALDRGEVPKTGTMPWDEMPVEIQDLQRKLLLESYGIIDENQGLIG